MRYIRSVTLLLLFLAGCAEKGDLSKEDLVVSGARVQKLADGFKFTEGPAVDAEGNVYFSDIPNNRIHKWLVAEKKLTTFRENSFGINGLYFDKDGNLYACQSAKGRIVSIASNGKETVLAGEYNGKRFNKPNDLWVDPKGGHILHRSELWPWAAATGR